MSHSQFHCTGRVYLDLHGLIFETSICYWQDQPGSPLAPGGAGRPAHRALGLGCGPRRGSPAAAPPEGRRARAARRSKAELCALLSGRGSRNIVLAGCGRRLSGSAGPKWGNHRPAPGSVAGQLGQTGRLGLATYRFGTGSRSQGGRPPRLKLRARPWKRTRRSGGTVRPNTSTGLAGGGPPMAGLVCQSVSVFCAVPRPGQASQPDPSGAPWGG